MIDQAKIEIMQKLVGLKYRQQQESFSKLLFQEKKLRSTLLNLDSQLQESRTSSDVEQKSIGADIMWQAWIGRRKHEVNMQLAQVLAMKEQHIAQVRSAYGKVIAADALFEKLRGDRQKKMMQAQLDRIISSSRFIAD